MPRTLLGVFAHPDNDVYGIAGTVALGADDPEFRFVLVLATDGDHGDMGDEFPATRDTLGPIRRAEDEAAWRALGREPDRRVWLGYEDGTVDEASAGELVDRVAATLAEEQPDVVATFGHPDHIAIGAGDRCRLPPSRAASLTRLRAAVPRRDPGKLPLDTVCYRQGVGVVFAEYSSSACEGVLFELFRLCKVGPARAKRAQDRRQYRAIHVIGQCADGATGVVHADRDERYKAVRCLARVRATRCLRPIETLKVVMMAATSCFAWCPRQDSNLRPAA